MPSKIDELLADIKAIIGKDVIIEVSRSATGSRSTDPYRIYQDYQVVEYLDGYTYALTFTIKSADPVEQDRGTSHVAVFTLQQLPGCCGVCLSHSSFIWAQYRRKGLQTRLMEFRIWAAKKAGYGTLLMTDKSKNIGQRKILDKKGVNKIHHFVNPRTEMDVDVSILDLRPELKEKRARGEI